MRTFCLCVYSFAICWSPLIVFGDHFAFLGATLGFLLGTFGAPRAPKGVSLASFWPPFGSLGTPWGHLGHLGLPSGAWDDFESKWTSVSVIIWSVCHACAQKVTSRNSAAAAPAVPGAHNGPKVAQEPQLPTPLHSRRGPGCREFRTNSLKLVIVIYHVNYICTYNELSFKI